MRNRRKRNPSEAFCPPRAALSRLRRDLARWFRKHGRDLPWRRSRDAYAIWVSEIMLQQTTVVAVVPYFERFLKKFPTIEALATAKEHDVLRLWEGLGYYSRARNLWRAARQVVADCKGTIPRDVERLLGLPGIGRYTAGAIASLAYDVAAPIVEANTLRVYARLLAFQGDVHSTSGRNVIWQFAESAVPQRAAGAFNQALMDLGATVCTPTEPDCPNCPVSSCCQAFRLGLQAEIPRPRVRPKTTHLTEAMVAVRQNGRYLLRKRPPGERWAGLWDFIRVGLESSESNGKRVGGHSRRTAAVNFLPRNVSTRTRQRIERAVADACGLTVDTAEEAFEFQHTVTRFRIRLICVIAEHCGGAPTAEAEYRWTTPSRFHTHALSMPARKFADRLLAAATGGKRRRQRQRHS